MMSLHNSIGLSFSLRPSLLIQGPLTTKTQPAPQVQTGRFVGFAIKQLDGHADTGTFARGTESFPRPLGYHHMRQVFGRLDVGLGRYYGVIDDDVSFLLETDHDLAVVDIFDGRTTLVGVAVGAA